ncbi:nitrate reductase [Clostridiales bacterium PH28_bin88]|nr:nitrate reductase [Clostridiales bacterium PH28_bin88]
MNFSRRDFIKAMAASATMAAAVSGKGEQVFAETPAPQVGEQWFKTVCRYCGTGCGVMVGVKNGRVVAVKGDPENPVNKGLLCVKGYYLPRVIYAPTRLKKPLIKKNGQFVEAGWDEALNLVAIKFKETIQQHGPDAIGFYGSGQNSIDEVWLFNKLYKGCIGTNNVDGNPRLCMASAVVGYLSTFGLDEPAGSYDDLDHADVFLIIGANMAEAHPVLYSRVAARKQQNPGIHIIVADPRKTRTFDIADQGLIFKPGTDVVLLQALANVIVQEGLVNESFVANHVNFSNGKEAITFEQYKEGIAKYTSEYAAEVTGIPAEEIRKAARMIAAPGKKFMSMWTMGYNQRVAGVFLNNMTHNLHLLTGKILEPGSVPLSLTGQPSACGSTREGGGLSHLLPAHRQVANAKHREEIAKLWGIDPGRINPKPGLPAVALFDAVAKGNIKALWVMCTNPAQSLPNLNAYRKGMEDCFMVVSEAFHPTETSQLADVVLPSAFWVEKEGFYGNTERRTQHMAKAVEPMGEAKPDAWQIIEVAKRMGYGDLFPYQSVKEVFEDYRRATIGTDLQLAPYDRYVKERGLRWPVLDPEGPDTLIRFNSKYDRLAKAEVDFYGKPDGKAVIYLREARMPAELSDKDYPFVLTTGRVLEQWHTATMTNTVPEINRAMPEAFAELNPDDAARLGIKNGDMVKLVSRRGEVVIRATTKGRGTPQPGLVFAVWFDPAKLTNLVTIDAVDPDSKEPEFKVCAVRVEKA